MNGFIFCSIFLLNYVLCISAIAQISLKIRWLGDVENKHSFDTLFANQEQAELYLQNYRKAWHNLGYASADFDIIEFKDSSFYAFFYLGEKFMLRNVIVSTTEKKSHDDVHMNFGNFQNKPLTTSLLDSIMTYIYKEYLQQGYPMVSINLDSIIIQHNDVTVYFIVHTGARATLDSIINKGNLQVLPEVLYALAMMKRGDAFAPKKIQHFGGKIRKMTYLRQKDPPLVEFKDSLFQVIVTLKKMRYNSLDGIIGILSQEQGQSLLFSGDISFSSINLLNLLEKIDIRWKSPAPRSQYLMVEIFLPVIPYTLFGIETKYRLQKFDTLFMNVSGNLFIFNPHSSRAFVPGITYKYFFSSRIGSQQMSNVTSLPPIADSRSIMYGLRVQSNTYDDIDNPFNGAEIVVEATVGEKKILNIQQLNSEHNGQIQEKTLIFEGQVALSRAIPLFSRVTLFLQSAGNYLKNKFLLENELYRLGGLYSLRGFDEDVFSVSSFVRQTFEFRYLFEHKSRFVIFFETAYMEKKLYRFASYYRPFSFGSGLVMNTDAGLFSIYLASGSFYGMPLNVRNMKVHFGYSILF